MGKISYRIGVCVAAALSVLVAGCPGNNGPEAPSSGSAATGASGRTFNPGSSAGGSLDPNSGTSSFITITKVLRSNIDPNSMIELIGQNSEIGTSCPTEKDCRCVFSWSEANGILRQSEIELLRREANMARCSFAAVSSDAKYFDVTLKILAANLSSNPTRVNMPTSNPSLDPSIASNYLPVFRYMCRDIIRMAQNTRLYMNNSLLDPKLWDQSQAYNFYTSALGLDYGAVPSSNGNGGTQAVPGWECPSIPNDPTSDPAIDYRLFSLRDIDLSSPTNITVVDGSGDNTIYPPDDNLRLDPKFCMTGKEATCEKYKANRHDFYVATFKSSIFKEPLCVTHKVGNRFGPINCLGIDSATGTVTLETIAAKLGARDAIGFAAVPDQNQHCPDPNVIKIPTGKKWAKIWRFKYSYKPRKVDDIANDIGNLFCTNRDDECMSNVPTKNLPGAFNSVCYNSRFPGGGKFGPAMTPTIGGTITGKGSGNCDMNASAGDEKGPGDYSSLNPLTPRVGATYCYPTNANMTCNPAPDPCYDPNGTNPNANCCFDIGPNNGNTATNKPGNFRKDMKGQVCLPTLIGEIDSSSAPVKNIANGFGGTLNWLGGGYDTNENISAGGTQIGVDVWLMGNGAAAACIEADTTPSGMLYKKFQDYTTLSVIQRKTTFLDNGELDDIVYIVTPEYITYEQINDRNGVIAQQYTPWRYPKNSDLSAKLIYDLDLGSESTSNPNERLSKFPLCVLQDTQKGLVDSTP